MFNLKSVYLYLVCFFTIIMLLLFTVFAIQKGIDIIFPSSYYTNSDESLEKQATQERDAKNQLNEDKKTVVKSVLAIIVLFPTFLYHWKKVQIEKKVCSQ